MIDGIALHFYQPMKGKGMAKKLIAPPCQSNPESYRASVVARYEAIKNALISAPDAPEKLILACKSAGALAALNIPRLGITPFGSRNTLFKYADDALKDTFGERGEFGWRLLDQMRRSLYTNLSSGKNTRGAHGIESRLRGEIAKLKLQVAGLQNVMTGQSRAYLKLLKEVSSLSKLESLDEESKARVGIILKRHHQSFDFIFTSSSNVFSDSGKITVLNTYEKNESDEAI